MIDANSAMINDLRLSIEFQHGGTATHVQSVPVKETFQGQAVWEGVVEVFDLEGNAKSTRAYAWSSPIEGSDKRRVFCYPAFRRDTVAGGCGEGGYRG